MGRVELLGYAVPAFALLMLVEWIGYRRDPDRSGNGGSARDTASNVATFTLGRLTKPLLQYLVPFSAVLGAAALTPWHLSPRSWWVWVLGLVVTDFCYYWAHRADHRVRLMWTAHSVHHSSEHFNLSTALRLSWLHPVANILRGLAWVPAALLGFPAWMIFLLQSIGLLYQFPIHTQRVRTLPRPIEFLFNTPAHHRVHHGANLPYIDKNYGGVFIIWDRMFGSFAAESEPIRYGLTKNIGTHNPLKVNYYELAALIRDVRGASTWRGRLGYVFGPPGWTEHQAPMVSAPTMASESASVLSSDAAVSPVESVQLTS
ncbi:sterol desaturase family protein [Nocardia sp. NPDC049220]|uniref:sterol desaturase family protein n=1 Tax=Nocardia sp. NPDC049220 TaxID=3155273 RepID=UPI0034105E6E